MKELVEEEIAGILYLHGLVSYVQIHEELT